jgi:hypothetical protein
MSTPRRTARSQSLPPQEVELLSRLYGTHPGASFYARAHALYHAGWPLRAIGAALEPPRSRSTVRSWVLHPFDPSQASTEPLPAPTLHTPAVYERKKPRSPGLDPADATRIHDLAPEARKFRARFTLNHPARLANDELTQLTRHLHSQHVSVQELANAAGVTYRAMARRLGK